MHGVRHETSDGQQKLSMPVHAYRHMYIDTYESNSTLQSRSQNHSKNRPMQESSETAYGVFDCDFGFDSQEWSCSKYGFSCVVRGIGHHMCPTEIVFLCASIQTRVHENARSTDPASHVLHPRLHRSHLQ